jgi:hypothetical protein
MNLLFPPASRYFSVETTTREERDGRVIVYLPPLVLQPSALCCCRSTW